MRARFVHVCGLTQSRSVVALLIRYSLVIFGHSSDVDLSLDTNTTTTRTYSVSGPHSDKYEVCTRNVLNHP